MILVNTAMPEGFHDYAAFIGTDNAGAGRQGARELRALLKSGAPPHPRYPPQAQGGKSGYN